MTIGKAGSGSVRGEDFNEVVDAILDGLTLEVTAAEIDSQAAQDGEVLTADGAGGASWEPGGGGSPFTPTDLNGQVGIDWAPLSLLGWWDASDAATIHEADASGFVSQWDDKSGSGNHATQGTAENQPTTGAATIGGLNALGFDGAATFLETPVDFGAGTNAFVACVFKAGAIDLDSFNYALIATTGGRIQLDNSADDPELQTPAGPVLSLTGVDLTAAHVMAYGGTDHGLFSDGIVRLDALVDTSAGSGAQLLGALGIAADGGADAFFLGLISQLVVVQGTLSPEQQQNVIDYLADKGGITL